MQRRSVEHMSKEATERANDDDVGAVAVAAALPFAVMPAPLMAAIFPAAAVEVISPGPSAIVEAIAMPVAIAVAAPAAPAFPSVVAVIVPEDMMRPAVTIAVALMPAATIVGGRGRCHQQCQQYKRRSLYGPHDVILHQPVRADFLDAEPIARLLTGF